MRRAVILGAYVGCIITGFAAVVEAAWLTFFEDLSYGALNEWVFLIQSFGLYLLAGCVLGGLVGVAVNLLARVFGKRFDTLQPISNTAAGIVGIIAAVGLTAYLFDKGPAREVEVETVAGALVLVGCWVVGTAVFWIFRILLTKIFGGAAGSKVERRILWVTPIILVGFLMVLLNGIHHIRTSDRRNALEQDRTPEVTTPRAVPNVILLTLDTVRAANLGLYGYERETTPNLTEFASTAVKYDTAYSPSAWTLPSHQSFFTGLHPSEISEKWGSDILNDNHVTLAEIFQAIGYQTAGVVGGPMCAGGWGMSQGFDYYEDNLPTIGTPILSRLANRLMPNLLTCTKRRANLLNEFVLRWLDNNADSPFFLFVNYFDAHPPVHPVFPYRDAFEGSYNVFHSFLMQEGAMQQAVNQGERDLSEAERDHWIALYDSEILYLDSEVGRLFDKLKELDVFDNTLIVVTSDHGHSYGEHHLSGHGGWIFEEVVKVPLIVRYPGGRDGGTVISERYSLVNLFHLILDEMGLAVPDTAGSFFPSSQRDFCVVENGPDQPYRHWKVVYSGHELRGVYNGRYKLVTIDGEMAELYDLADDPGETNNLLKDERKKADALNSMLTQILDDMSLPPEETAEGEELDKKLLRQLKAVGYM
jgi:arylsulfatase A-like enzyme